MRYGVMNKQCPIVFQKLPPGTQEPAAGIRWPSKFKAIGWILSSGDQKMCSRMVQAK